ncbi:MAG: TIGR02281 family clan AA aspartic protease [Rickettsiales bacterium]|nr:TIGR02281 family clan AA aspartic protease [Rickettsiales bacterium]
MRYIVIVLVLIFISNQSIGQEGSHLIEQAEVCPIKRTKQENSITFYVSRGGHYIVKSKVKIQSNTNSHPVYFLLDTGATKITLSARDAMNLGIDLDSLKCDVKVRTAKGINCAAHVIFDSIQVGNIVVKNIAGHVVKKGLSSSLLGMNFLSKLSKYQVSKGKLTLWQ